MNIADNQQLIIRKKSILSFVAMAVACIIQFLIIYTNFDRTSKSVITFLIFWPLYLFAFYQSVIVVGYYFRHFKSINILYLLLTIPVFAFLIYFVIKLIN